VQKNEISENTSITIDAKNSHDESLSDGSDHFYPYNNSDSKRINLKTIRKSS
jgi:hypothetical protein